MNIQSFETAGKHLGITLAFVGALTGLWRFVYRPINAYRIRQKAKDKAISDITCLCATMTTRLDTIEVKIDALKNDRQADHKTDAKIRTNLFMGQVAIVSAMRELAEHQGLKINGPVQLYYEQNIDALKTGLGIEN